MKTAGTTVSEIDPPTKASGTNDPWGLYTVDPKRIKGYRITKYNPLLFGPAGRPDGRAVRVRSLAQAVVAVRRELGITPTLGGQDSPALEVPVVVVFDCEETG